VTLTGGDPPAIGAFPSAGQVRVRGFSAACMPKDFGDPVLEARACRRAAALFDFSCLLRVRLTGSEALAVAEAFCGRTLSDMAPGAIRYALSADATGWLLSDLTVWRTDRVTVEIMSGRAEDVDALAAAAAGRCAMEDLSEDTAVLAVQGPKWLSVLRGLTDRDALARLARFRFLNLPIGGSVCRVGRLGFTGEDGVEILAAFDHAKRLWPRLAARARAGGIVAADRLRIEAGYALFTNEFAPMVTAVEAGLGRFRAGSPASPRVRRVCFRARPTTALTGLPWQRAATGTFPPERGRVFVTSACPEVSADAVLGMGYVRVEDAERRQDVTDPDDGFRAIALLPGPARPGAR
jgi:aminomethyltransferase